MIMDRVVTIYAMELSVQFFFNKNVKYFSHKCKLRTNFSSGNEWDALGTKYKNLCDDINLKKSEESFYE